MAEQVKNRINDFESLDYEIVERYYKDEQAFWEFYDLAVIEKRFPTFIADDEGFLIKTREKRK